MADNSFFSGSSEPYDYPEFLGRNWRKPGIIYAYQLILDLEAAKDIVSDALYKITKANPVFASAEHARNYFFFTIKNLCIDHIKANKAAPIDSPIVGPESETAHLDALEKALTYQKLIKLFLRCLTKTEQKIVTMAFLKDMTNLEIAQYFGTSIEGIRSRKSAALKKIRKKYPQYKKYWLLMFL